MSLLMYDRKDIHEAALKSIRLKRYSHYDQEKVIWNWAVKTLRDDILESPFSATSVAEEFIRRMDLYSVNDKLNSHKWSIAKDAGEYVLDTLIWFYDNFDTEMGRLKKMEDGRWVKKPIFKKGKDRYEGEFDRSWNGSN